MGAIILVYLLKEGNFVRIKVIKLTLSIIVLMTVFYVSKEAYALALPYVTLITSKSEITDSNAILYMEVTNINSEMITEIDIIISKDNKQLGHYKDTINSSDQYFTVSFNLQKDLLLTLTPHTTYQYAVYIKVPYAEYGPIQGTFKTTDAKRKASIELSKSKSKVTKNNAILYAVVKNPNKESISSMGIIVSRNKKQLEHHRKKLIIKKKNSNTVLVKYNLKKELLKLKIKRGTKYQYTMYVYVGGKKYKAKGTFKTKSK